MTEVNLLPRRSILRAICDRNPFYLLSAACMLFGCIALTNSSSFSPIRLNRLLILLATLNFYEFLLIGLALFLIVHRGLRRDGNILLILEAFFLVDVTFLNSEAFAGDLKIGMLINGVLMFLAIAKITAIFYFLGIPLTSGAFATIFFELATLFALPGVFKRIAGEHTESLPALAIYGAWWVIGGLPVLATFFLRDRFELPGYLQNRHIVAMLVILPLISLIAHVSTSNWVYHVDWYTANLAPLLLGTAVVMGGSNARRIHAQFLLPMIAIGLAMSTPLPLVFHLGPIGFAPLRCTLIGAMLVYLHGFVVHRHILFAFAASACLGLAGLGMSASEIYGNLNVGAQQTYTRSKRLWPRDRTDWGILSMVASFVLLMVGALVSLRKPRNLDS